MNTIEFSKFFNSSTKVFNYDITTNGYKGPFTQFNAGKPTIVKEIIISRPGGSAGYIGVKDFKLFASNDDITWTELHSGVTDFSTNVSMIRLS